MLKQWLLMLLRGWLVMIPSECRSVLETEGSSSMQSPRRILPQKEFHILFVITVRWMNTEDESRSSPGYLRRGDEGTICEQKHQDEREEMEGPERKRKSDHLGHSCSRLGKGHRSDQQMHTLSPWPPSSGFTMILHEKRSDSTLHILHAVDQAGLEETAERCTTDSPVVPCICFF